MQNDESSFRILDGLWGLLIAFGSIVWKMTMGRISAAEHAQAVLFDKLDKHAERSETRHLELLKALHEGLNKKLDR